MPPQALGELQREEAEIGADIEKHRIVAQKAEQHTEVFVFVAAAVDVVHRAAEIVGIAIDISEQMSLAERSRHGVTGALFATFCATSATASFMAYDFHELSPYVLIGNPLTLAMIEFFVTGAAPPVLPISILSASTPISQFSEAAAC